MLLVDEHAPFAGQARRFLERSGLVESVATSASLEEGLSLACGERSDVNLVAVDLASAPMDTFVARLKRRPRPPKVLVMSLSRDAWHRALETGADGFVCKDGFADEVLPWLRLVQLTSPWLHDTNDHMDGLGTERTEKRRSPGHVFVFRSMGIRCAVRSSAVECVLPMAATTTVAEAPAHALGAIDLDGRVVPVLDVTRRLGLPPRREGRSAHALAVRAGSRTVALAAEQILGVTELPAGTAPAAAVLPGLGPVEGAAVLPDGLLFLYDLAAFLSLEEPARADAGPAGEEREP